MKNSRLKMFKKMAFKILKFNFAALGWLLPLLLILPVLAPTRPFRFDKPASFVEPFERNENLQADADALLSFFAEMPPVPVFIRDVPVLKSGSSIESGVAYTVCQKPENPTIFVKRIFYEKTNRRQLVNILKHELTHAWLCRQNLMSGHDEIFRRKFKSVGGFGN
jgi:hypothetical protein